MRIRRSTLKRIIAEAVGGDSTVTGTHAGTAFSVQLPETMASGLIHAHQAGDEAQLYDLGIRAYEFIDGEYDNNRTPLDDALNALSELL